jgi:hypothetical protein
MDVAKESLDLIQVLINIVRSEQKMREDLQCRVSMLEKKQQVIVEMPRLVEAISAQAALSAKEN